MLNALISIGARTDIWLMRYCPAHGSAMLERFDVILLGAFGDPCVALNIHVKTISVGHVFKMDSAPPTSVRVRLLDTSLCPLKGVGPIDVDFVVVRENTEGVSRGRRRSVQAKERRTKLLFRKHHTVKESSGPFEDV